MGLLDDLMKGAAGAGLFAVVSNVINQNGGVQGLMQKFQQGGLGDVFSSWVGTGQNQAVSPDQIHQALGPDQIGQLASKLGIPADQLTQHLSQLLPQVVDKMTPTGQAPQVHQDVSPDAIKNILGQ